MSTASAHPTRNGSDPSLKTPRALAQDEVPDAAAGAAPISCDPVTLEVMEIRALTDVLLLQLCELGRAAPPTPTSATPWSNPT